MTRSVSALSAFSALEMAEHEDVYSRNWTGSWCSKSAQANPGERGGWEEVGFPSAAMPAPQAVISNASVWDTVKMLPARLPGTVLWSKAESQEVIISEDKLHRKARTGRCQSLQSAQSQLRSGPDKPAHAGDINHLVDERLRKVRVLHALAPGIESRGPHGKLCVVHVWNQQVRLSITCRGAAG